jgi:hypothetical protein
MRCMNWNADSMKAWPASHKVRIVLSKMVYTIISGCMLTGCAATLNLEVLQPAQITLPAHITKVTFVDRSRAKNAGQAILGAAEGLLTGEGLGADNEGRDSSAEGVIRIIGESPRFEYIPNGLRKKDLDSSLFAKQMDPATLKTICEPIGCNGVVSLEAFDSDVQTLFDTRSGTKTEDGKTVQTTEWSATRTTSVLSAWRVYDVQSGVAQDYLRDYNYSRSWSGTGDTKAKARNDLPGKTRTVRMAGLGAGESYGRRIAPNFIWVRRVWYPGGDDSMKMAKRMVRADDWAGATELWMSVVKNAVDPKLKGKAQFNLALAAEVAGDLDLAVAESQKAMTLLGNYRSRDYQQTLRNRQSQQRKLESQMQAVTPPPAEAQPTAIPAGEPAPPVPEGTSEGQ